MVRISLLGTAGGSASPTKNFPLITISHQNSILVLDMGEGSSKVLLAEGFDYTQIKTIMISHLHLDHFLGIPSFLLKKWLISKESHTDIYIPKGGRDVIDGIFMSLPDRMKKIFPMKIHELDDGECVSPIPGFQVYTRQLAHDPDEPAHHLNLAFKILVDDKTIVYTGDTNDGTKLIEFAKQADLLISEATFLDEQAELAYNVGHLTAGLAGQYATQAQVKHLVITHREPEADQDQTMYDQTASHYKGKLSLAYDGLTIDL